MRGSRRGQIKVTREILIRILYIKGKEQNIIPGKEIIQKINREIDTNFLQNALLNIGCDKLSVKEFENYYDMFFLIPGEDKKDKNLWRCPIDYNHSVI